MTLTEKITIDILTRVHEKLAMFSDGMEKDANRRINRLFNRLPLQNGEGLFSHSFGKGLNFRSEPIEELKYSLSSMFNNYMQPTGKAVVKAKAVAPSARIGQGKPVNVELKNFTRESLQSDPKWLPISSIVDNNSRVTTPFLNQKPIGSLRSTTSGIRTSEDLISLLQSKIYDKYTHDKLPFVNKDTKTPWTVSLEAFPSGRYGNFGIVIPDHGVKGTVKVDKNQAKRGLSKAEYRVSPDINPNGTLTTGIAEGFPFYLVGNSAPSEAERAIIRALKERLPSIMPIREGDLKAINKRLPANDVRQFWLKSIKGKIFNKNKAEQIVTMLEKAETDKIKETEVFKSLLGLL